MLYTFFDISVLSLISNTLLWEKKDRKKNVDKKRTTPFLFIINIKNALFYLW